MPRKATAKRVVKAQPLDKRFVIVNTECNNMEGIERTMEEALSTISENIYPSGRDWEPEKIFVLEVTAIHSVRASKVESVSVDISDLDFEL